MRRREISLSRRSEQQARSIITLPFARVLRVRQPHVHIPCNYVNYLHTTSGCACLNWRSLTFCSAAFKTR